MKSSPEGAGMARRSRTTMTPSVVVLALVAAAGTPALADTDVSPEEPTTKKAEYLATKAKAPSMTAKARAAWQAELRERIGKEPDKVVNIFNTWTHETVAVEVGEARASVTAVRRALRAARERANKLANEHLRCHFTNEPAAMDPRLFRVLVGAARHFGVERVEIISGFRASKYNLTLRKKGRQVARNSQHTKGNAVDFRLPGVGTSRLRGFARSLRLGGVGYYPRSGFIHVDVGPVRTWRGD